MPTLWHTRFSAQRITRAISLQGDTGVEYRMGSSVSRAELFFCFLLSGCRRLANERESKISRRGRRCVSMLYPNSKSNYEHDKINGRTVASVRSLTYYQLFFIKFF